MKFRTLLVCWLACASLMLGGNAVALQAMSAIADDHESPSVAVSLYRSAAIQDSATFRDSGQDRTAPGEHEHHGKHGAHCSAACFGIFPPSLIITSRPDTVTTERICSGLSSVFPDRLFKPPRRFGQS